MEGIVALLIPIGCGCILPIFAIWMGVRKEMNETNTRTQIVLAAIEKNPEMDLEELMAKISPKKKLLKEKLLSKLQYGGITSLLGGGLLGYGIYLECNSFRSNHSTELFICGGIVLLGVGIAFLISYFVGKKMLAKEMEAEQAKLLEQA